MAFLVSENQSCLFVAPVCVVTYFPKAALGCLRQERGQRMCGVIQDGEVAAKAEHRERQLLGAGKRAENPAAWPHHPIHTLSSLIQSLNNHESSTSGLESQGGSSYICSHKGQMGWEHEKKEMNNKWRYRQSSCDPEGHPLPAAQPTGRFCVGGPSGAFGKNSQIIYLGGTHPPRWSEPDQNPCVSRLLVLATALLELSLSPLLNS